MSPLTWISSESSRAPYVTIDNQRRIYLSTSACDLLGVPTKAKFSLIIGYDPVNKRLVVAKPDVVRVPSVRPFNFDKRRYAYAGRIIEDTKLTAQDLPTHYDYVGEDYSQYPKGAYVFQLAGFDAPDDAGRDGK